MEELLTESARPKDTAYLVIFSYFRPPVKGAVCICRCICESCSSCNLWDPHLKKVQIDLGFGIGKKKLAPQPDLTVPRLELCAAVLAVEIVDIVVEEIGLQFNSIQFFTDSKIVLDIFTIKQDAFMYMWITESNTFFSHLLLISGIMFHQMAILQIMDLDL